MNILSAVFYLQLVVYVKALEMPGSCKYGQYYEPGSLACQACPANVSMVPSEDGFSCTCEENSIPVTASHCRRCNTTEVLSSDGRSCVPRRCQSAAGRTVCRRCPGDYITVTQNFDGSPMKEISCVKCARGFKAENNACVRCESCACGKLEVVVRGRCVAKKFMTERPKYDETKVHPYELLDAVRDEYFCTQNDNRSCSRLADQCVKSFYSNDLAGPCRLWIQPRITRPNGLPTLTIEPSEKNDITLNKGTQVLRIATVTYTSTGGVRIEKETNTHQLCFLPFDIQIGVDFSKECNLNISDLERFTNENIAPYLYIDDELRALPLTIRRPDGTNVQRGLWPSGMFRRYFIINKLLSTSTNMTTTVYLQTILIRIQVQREKSKRNALKMAVSMEVKYATKSPLSKSDKMTMTIQNEMPGAGIVRGLEIWGGVLGAFLSLYAVVQWRGVIRRGGVHYSLIPLLAGSVSDALYFAVLFSTLYALAANSGSLNMSLPLSRYEDHMIRAFLYSATVLKVLKIAWMIWKQCRCDILFIVWSQYNTPEKESLNPENREEWKKATLAREWCRLQTIRRCSPGYTACLTFIILHVPYITSIWQSPQDLGYQWAVISLTWWCSYTALIVMRWAWDRVVGSPSDLIPTMCKDLGLSLWVFQEEYYAHYVHGRNDDDMDGRSVTGALASCRIVCVPQLRMVYKQLSTPGIDPGLGEAKSKQALLSRFLAAFIERALDGLSWVANERTIAERLLDVELINRENGTTSVLLYDSDVKTPSYLSLTWWGQEWSLGTLDAMVFGVVFLAAGAASWALLGTVGVHQIHLNIRSSLAIKNQKAKADLQ